MRSSVPELYSTVGCNVSSFAETNLKRANLPVPNAPAPPPNTHHKTLPQPLVRAANTIVTATSSQVPGKSLSSLREGLNLYRTRQERLARASVFQDLPIQENLLYPFETNSNAAVTGPVSFGPPALVRNTSAQTKAHLITISGAPNQHPDPGFEVLSLPPRSEFINSALPIGSSYRGSRSTSHDTLCQPSEIPVLNPMPSGSPSQRQSQSEPDPITPPSGGATPLLATSMHRLRNTQGLWSDW
jgi:hypothetical protein